MVRGDEMANNLLGYGHLSSLGPTVQPPQQDTYGFFITGALAGLFPYLLAVKSRTLVRT